MRTLASIGKVLLRPHHIYCFHFTSFSDPLRGKAYEEARNKIDSLLKYGTGSIEVKYGPDFLCEACPYFNGQGCSNPRGDEKAVKKWDEKILKALALRPGQVYRVDVVKYLVSEKAPLDFCLSKCLYHQENTCNPRAIRKDIS